MKISPRTRNTTINDRPQTRNAGVHLPGRDDNGRSVMPSNRRDSEHQRTFLKRLLAIRHSDASDIERTRDAQAAALSFILALGDVVRAGGATPFGDREYLDRQITLARNSIAARETLSIQFDV